MARIIKDRVKELSASTGTGDFSLSAAIPGFRTFDSVCSVGDRFPYVIEAVSDGVPTGAWEVGEGTYSASGVITRTTVVDSTNGGDLVDFAVGDKHVYIGLTAKMGGSIREKLTANTTFYVATTGSDSNDGRTVGTPFLTIQAAINHISTSIDCNNYNPTIQIADGTYAENVSTRQIIGTASVSLIGNTSTPANVVISPASGTAVQSATPGLNISISGVTLSTTNGTAIHAVYTGRVTIAGEIVFGACGTGTHIYSDRCGLVEITSNYTISGSAAYHYRAVSGSRIAGASRTVTLTGTPAFTNFALTATNATLETTSFTFSGAATGSRYSCITNSVISVGGSSTYFPGSTAGSTATSGVYA